MIKVTSISETAKQAIIDDLDVQLGNLNPYNLNHLREAQEIFDRKNQIEAIPVRKD